MPKFAANSGQHLIARASNPLFVQKLFILAERRATFSNCSFDNFEILKIFLIFILADS
jgi:hypothetical protein